MKNNITPLDQFYKKMDEDFSKISKSHSLAKFFKDFSKRSSLKIFFDSEDYFTYVKDYSGVGDFAIREKKDFKSEFNSDFTKSEICYFDFFTNLDFEGKKFPLYMREKNSSENEMNIIYSGFFRHEEREHQIYWTHVDEILKVSHPKKIEEIVLYYKDKKLNPLLIKGLEDNLIKLREENPEVYKPTSRTDV